MHRSTPVLAAVVLALGAGQTRADPPSAAQERRAFATIRAHGLLTERQIACAYLDRRDDSTHRVLKVGVYEIHDQSCGGDPEVTHRLFDLELDLRTGAARWDDNPDLEMRPVPPAGGKR